MGSIATKIEGEQFSETLPQTAQIADKLTVIRSMTHGEAAHERGTHNMFTGYRPSPALAVSRAWAAWSPTSTAPRTICRRMSAFPISRTFTRAPATSARRSRRSAWAATRPTPGFRVQDLNLPGGINESRFATPANGSRRSQRRTSPSKEKSDNIAAMDTFYQRAYSLISSQKAREAFNIAAEPAKIRDEYGRNPAGQRMLMARRLVAAGVRMVDGRVRRLGHAHPDRRRHERPDARVRPGIRGPDSRPRPDRPARTARS